MAAPAGMVLIPAAKAGADEALKIGQSIAKAATTPIYSRRITERWDTEREEWVPDTRERERNITPMALVAGALVGLALAAVGQRAVRTGTLGRVEAPSYWTVTQNGKAGLTRYKTREAAQAVVDKLNVKDDPTQGAAGLFQRGSGGGTALVAEHTQRKWNIRTRDSIADYQPIGKVL